MLLCSEFISTYVINFLMLYWELFSELHVQGIIMTPGYCLNHRDLCIKMHEWVISLLHYIRRLQLCMQARFT
jgi:hypothetical protein